MRIIVKLDPGEGGEKFEVPWEGGDPAVGYLDLRAEPRALERIEPAQQRLPLRSFLGMVNGADSLFSTLRCSAGLTQDEAEGSEPCEFASRLGLFFAAEEMNFERRSYEGLADGLRELLEHEAAADTLRAELTISRCLYRAANRSGFCLTVVLTARGQTPAQAELRWGLGLARLQQALLFTSRVLRHHRQEPA